jgi:WD40 repeat protein
MGLIAHPDKIVGISSTSDGKLFFTSGGDDYAVNIWNVDFLALEENFFSNIMSLLFLSLKIR